MKKRWHKAQLKDAPKKKAHDLLEAISIIQTEARRKAAECREKAAALKVAGDSSG